MSRFSVNLCGCLANATSPMWCPGDWLQRLLVAVKPCCGQQLSRLRSGLPSGALWNMHCPSLRGHIAWLHLSPT